LSAYVAKRDYGIEDTNIINAIDRHQAGHAEMTELDKIILIADNIEPSRKGMEWYRDNLSSGLDEAFIKLYADTIIRVAQDGLLFFEHMSDLYNTFLLKKGLIK